MAAKKPTKKPKDAIALLKEDHEKVRGLLASLEKTGDKAKDRRVTLLEKISKELMIHTTIEEEIFYPAYHEAAQAKEDKKIYFEANEEHSVVKMYLPRVQSGELSGEKFTAEAKVLRELVEHHAKEEEKEMFKRAKKFLSKDELVDLGARMAARKRQLQREG
ncbi:MAG: hemerythrin domain-containing protein [Acidobacteriota bacterium]